MQFAFVLSAAVLVAQASSAPLGATVPYIADIIPRRVPVTGNSLFTVHLSEKQDTVAADSQAVLCRLANTAASSSLVYNATTPAFPGRLKSSTEIECGPTPRVTVEGPGLVEVSLNNGSSWLSGDPAKPQPTGGPGLPLSTGMPTNRLTLFQLVDAALDRRPYLAESKGFILLRSDTTLMGHRLHVKATLPAVNKSWEWVDVEAGGEASLPFDLTALPSKVIHNDILVTISDPEDATLRGGVTIQRRFHRIPTAPSPSVESVQVDHTTKGLLVDGKPWVGQGWYVSYLVDVTWNITTEAQLKKLANVVRYDLAPRGINQLMFYGLYRYTPEAQLRFLDVCHEVGVKVIAPPPPPQHTLGIPLMLVAGDVRYDGPGSGAHRCRWAVQQHRVTQGAGRECDTGAGAPRDHGLLHL